MDRQPQPRVSTQAGHGETREACESATPKQKSVESHLTDRRTELCRCSRLREQRFELAWRGGQLHGTEVAKFHFLQDVTLRMKARYFFLKGCISARSACISPFPGNASAGVAAFGPLLRTDGSRALNPASSCTARAPRSGSRSTCATVSPRPVTSLTASISNPQLNISRGHHIHSLVPGSRSDLRVNGASSSLSAGSCVAGAAPGSEPPDQHS